MIRRASSPDWVKEHQYKVAKLHTRACTPGGARSQRRGIPRTARPICARVRRMRLKEVVLQIGR